MINLNIKIDREIFKKWSNSRSFSFDLENFTLYSFLLQKKTSLNQTYMELFVWFGNSYLVFFLVAKENLLKFYVFLYKYFFFLLIRNHVKEYASNRKKKVYLSIVVDWPRSWKVFFFFSKYFFIIVNLQ